MNLLPRPTIFAIVTTSSSTGTGAPAPSALPLTGFPSTATFSLRRVQPPFNTLPMTQRADKVFRSQPQMHEVAEASPVALAVFILSAARFAEVCYW